MAYQPKKSEQKPHKPSPEELDRHLKELAAFLYDRYMESKVRKAD